MDFSNFSSQWNDNITVAQVLKTQSIDFYKEWKSIRKWKFYMNVACYFQSGFGLLAFQKLACWILPQARALSVMKFL